MLPTHRGHRYDLGYDGDKSRSQSAFVRQVSLYWKKLRLLKLYQQVPFFAVGALLLFFAVYWFPRALRDAIEMQKGTKLYQQILLEKGLKPSETIPVLIPCYSRPAYLKEVLESLQKANNVDKVSPSSPLRCQHIAPLFPFSSLLSFPSSISSSLLPNAIYSQTVLIFSQDGSHDEITELIDAVNFTSTIHLRHNPPYWGLPSLFLRTDAPTASNVFFLLTFAFDWLHAPAAIVLESDIVISPDGLDYFQWAWKQSMSMSMASDSKLRDRLFTVNGYYEGSSAEHDLYTFTTHEYGFMVWGWLCPGTTWPMIKRGFTWFGNWDITMEESIRKPTGREDPDQELISISPVVSRTRNIGMKGINFDINDPQDVAKWTQHYIPTADRDQGGGPISYRGKKMRVIWDDAEMDPLDLELVKKGKEPITVKAMEEAGIKVTGGSLKSAAEAAFAEMMAKEEEEKAKAKEAAAA